MNNTTGANKTSKSLLKKEINETAINEYAAVGNITITVSLQNNGNSNGYKISVTLRKLKL